MRFLPLAVVFAALLSACPEPVDPVPDAGEPKKCVGGVIRPDGTCEAKCDPSKCVANNTCIDNKCQLKCTTHEQCKPYIQQCLPAKEDDTSASVHVCTNTPPLEYGDPCPNGNECSLACSNWQGPGDLDAFCAPFCAQDADCPGGYECIYRREPTVLCEDAGVGNDGFCGRTDDPCLSIDDISLPDSGYGLTPYCIQRGVCHRKDVCSTCQTDVDCSYNPELACVQINDTEKACLARCTMSSDCPRGYTCGGGFCLPFQDKCKGAGGFCSQCKSDLDCASPLACRQLHGTEKGCADPAYSKVCQTSLDCPVAPSGRRGQCVSKDDLGTTTNRCGPPYDGDIYSCY